MGGGGLFVSILSDHNFPSLHCKKEKRQDAKGGREVEAIFEELLLVL